MNKLTHIQQQKMIRKTVYTLLAILLIGTGFHCAGPQKVTTPGLGYKAGDYKKQSYKKLLVLSRVKDDVVKQKMENSLADLFNRSGQKAVAAHKVISAEDMTSQEAFLAKLETLGVDALVAYTFYGTTNAQGKDVVSVIGSAPVTSIGIFNVFLSPSYSFDINTQLNSTTRIRTELYNKTEKDIRWYRVVEVEMNNGIDIGCDQLAGRALLSMKQDGVF